MECGVPLSARGLTSKRCHAIDARARPAFLAFLAVSARPFRTKTRLSPRSVAGKKSLFRLQGGALLDFEHELDGSESLLGCSVCRSVSFTCHPAPRANRPPLNFVRPRRAALGYQLRRRDGNAVIAACQKPFSIFRHSLVWSHPSTCTLLGPTSSVNPWCSVYRFNAPRHLRRCRSGPFDGKLS
jgi:hypothetical protein